MNHPDTHNEHAEEAREKWGDTEAYRQSQERVKTMTKEDFAAIGVKHDTLMRAIVAHMPEGPQSPVIQELIAQHYDNLRVFYEPTPELYRGLAEMYVSDPRFSANYEKYAPGLAVFMRDAMIYFAEHSGASQ